MRHSFCLVVLSLSLCACTALMHQQDYAAGKRYFLNGDFKEAYHQLLLPASDGKADAQYAIGYMTYYGYGVAQDSNAGIFWMDRAAAQHYLPAIKALNLIRSPTGHSDTLIDKA